MPKLGMEPIRREQICRAAATVIAREGFAGTTLRKVADEAGVSTGMLNHYFSNRQDLLTQTLVFVSERTQAQSAGGDGGAAARAGTGCGPSSTPPSPTEVSANEGWRVWINAYGEAVHLAELRHTIEARLQSWYPILDHALEGLVPPETPERSPGAGAWTRSSTGWRSRRSPPRRRWHPERVRDEVIRMLLPDCRARQPPPTARRRRRARSGLDAGSFREARGRLGDVGQRPRRARRGLLDVLVGDRGREAELAAGAVVDAAG